MSMSHQHVYYSGWRCDDCGLGYLVDGTIKEDYVPSEAEERADMRARIDAFERQKTKNAWKAAAVLFGPPVVIVAILAAFLL